MKNNARFKKMSVIRLTQISVLATMSLVLYVFGPRFPIPGIFPSFLEFNFSNLPAVLGGFLLGPIGGGIIVLLKFVSKIILVGSSTTYVGEVVDLIIGGFVVIGSSVVYRYIKSSKKGLYAIILGIMLWVIIAIITNIFIAIPFYIQFYFNGNIAPLVGMCSMIPGINANNFMTKYIIFAVIPFNLILANIVMWLSYFMFKRLRFLFDNEIPIESNCINKETL